MDLEKVKPRTFSFKNFHQTYIKVGESVSKVQSVLCEDAVHLKRWNNNVYIFMDLEKVKPRTFAFKNFHQTSIKVGESVSKVQSVLCEDTVHLKRCNNDVYIFMDLEKVKPRTFAFKNFHQTVYVAI